MKKFLKVVKGILTENLLFKLGSLLFAFLVWLAVVNINDPEITKTINAIPIKVTEEETLVNQNMKYTVEGNEFAQITITGKRSKVSKLTERDFIARAPLSEMSQVCAVPVYVEFKNSLYQNYVIINQKTKTITVNVENVVTRKYAVEINTEGQPFADYVIGATKIGRSEISITGSESTLNLISKVCVDVDVNDATSDIEGKFDIKIYAADGTPIDRSLVTLSSQKTKVEIEILKNKDVLVKFEVEGKPEKDYTVTEVKTSATTVKIKGKPDVVDKCDSIVIPKGTFDITGIIQTQSFSADLDKYLPEGVSIVTPEARNFEIKVVIDKLLTKRYELNMDHLDINNVPEGFQAAILSSNISVRIKARKEFHNMLDINKIAYFVDLTGAKEGIADYKISFSLREEYEIIDVVKAKVRVYKIDEETGSEKQTEKESETESIKR